MVSSAFEASLLRRKTKHNPDSSCWGPFILVPRAGLLLGCLPPFQQHKGAWPAHRQGQLICNWKSPISPLTVLLSGGCTGGGRTQGTELPSFCTLAVVSSHSYITTGLSASLEQEKGVRDEQERRS